MAFVAALGGVVVVGVLATIDHSDYSDHYNHSEYGDSTMVEEIKRFKEQVDRKKKDIDEYKDEINRRYQERLDELKQKYPYDGLSPDTKNIFNQVKKDMKEELEVEIQEEKNKLERINQMIKRINEIELTETQQKG